MMSRRSKQRRRGKKPLVRVRICSRRRGRWWRRAQQPGCYSPPENSAPIYTAPHLLLGAQVGVALDARALEAVDHLVGLALHFRLAHAPRVVEADLADVHRRRLLEVVPRRVDDRDVVELAALFWFVLVALRCVVVCVLVAVGGACCETRVPHSHVLTHSPHTHGFTNPAPPHTPRHHHLTLDRVGLDELAAVLERVGRDVVERRALGQAQVDVRRREVVDVEPVFFKIVSDGFDGDGFGGVCCCVFVAAAASPPSCPAACKAGRVRGRAKKGGPPPCAAHHTSVGRPCLISSSFSYLSRPM